MRLISIAPMMEYTDRHDRFFLRLISKHALLYTEMLTTCALLHGNVEKLLSFHKDEQPLALQLGGSNPDELAVCADLGEQWGYAEINLNVGCPSERVRNGQFGACLMLDPTLVADCVRAMRAVVSIPVTVKCRIGVDEQDSYDALCHFIQTVAEAGCQVFIMHARKAWLKGLSPKQNREIPPLRYDVVYRIKQDFPKLTIILNGGIKTLDQIQAALPHVDGVMIGREAYSNPYFLMAIEQALFGITPCTRVNIIEKMLPYIEEQLKNNIKLSSITRHILGLFHAEPGGRMWRRYLSEHAHKKGAGIEVVQEALKVIPALD